MANSSNVEKAYELCDRLARQRARNFYPAFRFLPRDRRLALSAFYTYCTLSDDVVDEQATESLDNNRARLSAWRTKVDNMFAGNADEPTFMALSDAVNRFDLPQEPFYNLLDGVEMDLTIHRYRTFDDLLIYCRRVASSVGVVSAKIFGCTHPGGEIYADNLGIAFQLTNILRDVAEDYKMGRIYLPEEDLQRFEYSEGDLKAHLFNENFRALMDFQYTRAMQFYRAAQVKLAEDQARSLFTAELMKSVYLRLLNEMKRNNFDVFATRVRVPRYRMLFGLGSAVLKRFSR
ncbi:squalene/phytoene synthase family protein [bacterium]|nr:squalene/phytoene synthase family protein [bacterium]MBU1652117.1 squalene/phytoene synthase family protein [bacterium]